MRFLVLVLIGFPLAPVACIDPPSPADTRLSLKAPATAPLQRVPLVPLQLATQADFDAFEEAWLARRDRTQLVAALEALASAQPSPEPLLLQRLALLAADDLQQDANALQGTLAASTKLRDRAPEDPHTLWLNGWVMWLLLNRGGALGVEGPNADVADALVLQWTKLLAVAPSYVGPRTHDAAQVRELVARVKAARAEVAAAPPAPAPVVPRALDATELAALAELERFTVGTEGNRQATCRTVREREPRVTPSSAELRLSLACATLVKDIDGALTAIAALSQRDGRTFDACAAVSALSASTSKNRVASALAKRPLPINCP